MKKIYDGLQIELYLFAEEVIRTSGGGFTGDFDPIGAGGSSDGDSVDMPIVRGF